MNRPAEIKAEYKPVPYILGVEAYISPEYARAERDKLWSKVWLQAGRLEEIPEVGNFITYDIMDQSILIVRNSPDSIKAFYNVCQHRGRRLVDATGDGHGACGKAKQFKCNFHGWRWNTDGENVHILDKADWDGVLTPENVRLEEVKVDSWSGWIFISLDPDIEPLLDYLAPIPEMLDPFELDKMRFRWRRWGIFDCNWKVALEAFNEAYHVEATHPEFVKFGSFRAQLTPHGRHTTMGYAPALEGDDNKGKLRLGSGGDPRVNTAEMVEYTMREVDTNFTETLRAAAQRLPDELPEGTPAPEVLKHWLESARKDDEARGVFWPVIDPEHVNKSGNNWQVFPNFQIGHAVNNALCYTARPYGDNPDKCIMEVMTFELYPEGEDPKAQWEYMGVKDPRWGSVLPQDFDNMAAVQQGMKSKGFKGPRPNPIQENAVTSLHRNLADYMNNEDVPRPLK